MNRKRLRIAGALAAFAMMVGAGVAVGASHAFGHDAIMAKAGDGETAVFGGGAFNGQGTMNTGSACSLKIGNITVSSDKGYGTADHFRSYSGSVVTIAADTGCTIKALSFSFSESKYKGGLNTSYTGLDTDSWEATLSGQARFTNITVTYNSPVSDEYISSMSVAVESYTWNAGDIITAEKIGAVTTTGSSPTDNYTDYTAALCNWDGESETSSMAVTLGTTYVSYNNTRSHLVLQAHLPTVAQGNTKFKLYVSFTVNNIASSSFKIALTSAPTTEVTSRNAMAGFEEDLKIFGYTSGTNPAVEWSSSDNNVVTVSDSGHVVAVAAGSATVTATSVQNNVSGVKTTASVAYTIAPAPVYSCYFGKADGKHGGFTDVTAEDIDAIETKYETKEFNGIEWTLKTVSSESKNVRVVTNNTLIQIGTSKNPATEFSLRSNIFAVGNKAKITGVSILAYGASKDSVATISVTTNEGSFTCNEQATASLSGSTPTTYDFESTGAFGHITINFASVAKGIMIESIVVTAITENTDKCAAYAFAAQLEAADSCSADGKDQLIAAYNSLSPEAKSMIDPVILYDHAESSDDPKTDWVTVSEKMAYIIDTYGDPSSQALRLNENAVNNNSILVIVAIVGTLGLATLGLALVARKQRR